jgi:hypothetical protein
MVYRVEKVQNPQLNLFLQILNLIAISPTRISVYYNKKILFDTAIIHFLFIYLSLAPK